MQRRCSCQNFCSIHVYVVPTAMCTPVLYTLIVTVQLSFTLKDIWRLVAFIKIEVKSYIIMQFFGVSF